MMIETFPHAKAAKAMRRFRADAEGATAIEFALIAPVLVLFLVGIVEIGLMVGGQQVLEDAVFVGSRTSKTGYTAAGSDQKTTITAAIKKAAAAYLDENKVVVTSTAYADYSSIKPEPFTDLNKNGVRDSVEPYTDVNGNGKYDDGKGTSGYGAAGEIVVFTATYPWPLHTPLIADLIAPGGIYTLSARAVVKNEPYGIAP